MISQIKKNSINLYDLKTLKDLNHVEDFFDFYLIADSAGPRVDWYII